MTCTRCSGLMVEDHLLDMKESYVPMWMQALRCLTCGNILDPLIHYHRMVQRARRATRLDHSWRERRFDRSRRHSGQRTADLRPGSRMTFASRAATHKLHHDTCQRAAQ